MSDTTKKRKFDGRPESKTTLDRIAGIVERTEETTKSQSSKLEFLETVLRETKAQINETTLKASAATGDGTNLDKSQVEGVIREEIRRIEDKIEQVKSISCSLIEEVSEANKNELQTVQENLHEMIMSIEDKMMDVSMNHRLDFLAKYFL